MLDAAHHDTVSVTDGLWPVSLVDAPTAKAAIESWAEQGFLAHPDVLTMVWSAVAELTRTADRAVLNMMAVQCDDASDVVSSTPAATATWLNAARALSAAASSVSMASLPMHVRAHNGKAKHVLELVARAGGRIQREQLRSELTAGELSDSHLSHLLRDLEDAGLIAREQFGRHVEVALLERGAIALRSVAPADAKPLPDLVPEAAEPVVRAIVEPEPSSAHDRIATDPPPARTVRENATAELGH